VGDADAVSAPQGPLAPPRPYRFRGMVGFARKEAGSLRAARAGSVAEFDALFQAHWPRAYRAAYLVVHDTAAAEDIAQEAFLAAIRALDRFDRRRPFGPWLHRIVVNRAIDWTRSRGLRREVASGDLPDRDADDREPTGGDPYSDDLTRALASLSPEHRAVIVLRHLLEYTPGEIARLLELPRGTVNSRLRRGLDHLRGELGEERP
jgi:RNA polymerase sigma-70 factor, ECF subfamily